MVESLLKYGWQDKKIMLVDDDEISRKVLDKMLAKIGFCPVIAENGVQAVYLASIDSYDIILMDIRMPEMDGYQATREIRSIDEANGKRSIIIAQTANALIGDEGICLDAGMDDYISKPVQFTLLYQKIQKWIQVDHV